jgi:hypothetical protein
MISCGLIVAVNHTAMSAAPPTSDVATPSERLEFVLQKPISQESRMYHREGKWSSLLFAVFTFRDDGLAKITRVSSAGHIQRCLVSSNQYGIGVDKRFGGEIPVFSQETLDRFKTILQNLPTEFPDTPLDRLLVIRHPTPDGLRTSYYDRTKLPKPLQVIADLTARRKSKFDKPDLLKERHAF